LLRRQAYKSSQIAINSRGHHHGVEAPEIGRWYRSRNKPLFEVVAINDRDGSVELQHFDGTIEEVDPDDWVSMRAESTGAPEDWSGSVDISVEDLPESSQAIHMDWQTELDALDDDYLSGNDLISTD
jgi:hypothetical protein